MRSHQLKVSIITPTLNSSTYIEECMTSVTSQDYNNFEHIIVDGGSTDDTLEKIRRHSDDRTHILTGEDRGIYDAINKGVLSATGEIIGVLNSDDSFYNESTLSTITLAFERTNCSLCYGDLIYISRDSKEKIVRLWRPGNFCRKSIFSGWMPPHPTVYARRKIYQEYGLYKISYKISGDYDFLTRVMLREKQVTYIPKILVCMRTGGVSTKGLRNLVRKSREDLLILKKHNLGGLLTLAQKILRKLPQLLNVKTTNTRN